MRQCHSDGVGAFDDEDSGGSRCICFVCGLDLDLGTWKPPGKPLAKCTRAQSSCID